jgi:hypothetical protein
MKSRLLWIQELVIEMWLLMAARWLTGSTNFYLGVPRLDWSNEWLAYYDYHLFFLRMDLYDQQQ